MKLWFVLAGSKHVIGLVDDVSEVLSAIHVLQFEDCNTFLLTKSAVPVRKRFVAAKSRYYVWPIAPATNVNFSVRQ